jgi:transposase-like protein
MDELHCPHCGQTEGQRKIGRTASGRQRSSCKACRRKYIPVPKTRGYDPQLRRKAVQLAVDGVNYRRIGRLLGVTHQSVANWVAAHARSLPDPPLPLTGLTGDGSVLAVGELDELYTFAGAKKAGLCDHPRGARDELFPGHGGRLRSGARTAASAAQPHAKQ